MQYKQGYFNIKEYEITNQAKIDFNKVLDSKLKYVELELSKIILSKQKLDNVINSINKNIINAINKDQSNYDILQDIDVIIQ